MPNGAARAGLTLVTHRALPAGAPDDRLLAEALRRRGAATRFAVWDDPAVDWAATPLAVVRSTWDYYRDSARWRSWVARAGAATTLLNPPDVLRWNTDKRYLLELAARGVPCVPTAVVTSDDEAGEPASLAAVAERLGWADVVVKPAVAASAFGARRFGARAWATEGDAHLRALRAGGAVFVQPYLAEVEHARERSLVFVAGAFAHAFTKPAFSTDAAGGTAIAAHDPPAGEHAVAAAALGAVPGGAAAALYARVDLVPTAAGPLLMELELVEPDLGLRLHAGAADRLAGACLARGGPAA